MGQHRRDDVTVFQRAAESLQEAGWRCEPPPPTEEGVPSALHTASETVIGSCGQLLARETSAHRLRMPRSVASEGVP